MLLEKAIACWTFRIFLIFILLGEGEGGVRDEAPEGIVFLLKIPRGGGEGGRGPSRCVRRIVEFEGGGAKYQISFEPGFGAYQGLAQKIKVPFSRIFCLFLQFGGFEGDFKTHAKPRYAPNSG